MTVPPGIKEFNISNSGALKGPRCVPVGVKVDVAAIEWPANATALVYEGGTLVCRFTDPDESKEGAETSEIHIVCSPSQVIGTSSVAERTGMTNICMGMDGGQTVPGTLFRLNRFYAVSCTPSFFPHFILLPFFLLRYSRDDAAAQHEETQH